MNDDLSNLIPETIVLSKEDFEWFINQLLDESKPNEKLQAALNKYKGNDNVTILE